jgi:hypothetical protein
MITRKLSIIGALIALMLTTLSVTGAAAQPGSPSGEVNAAAGRPTAVVLVGRPQAALLNATAGAADNFINPEAQTRTLVEGQSVRFVAGPYQGIWYNGAQGSLSSELEVAQQNADTWTVVGADRREGTDSGPKVVRGELHVDAPFDTAGTFTLRARLTTTASPDGGTPVQAQDDVMVTIHVVAQADLGSISGQVTAAEGGQPIPGLVAIAGSEALHFRRTARTDRQGNYTIQGLPPGDYIVAVPGGDSPFAGMFYSNANRREDATPVTVKSGTNTPDINFALTRKTQPQELEQSQQPEAGQSSESGETATQQLSGLVARLYNQPQLINNLRDRLAGLLGRPAPPRGPQPVRVASPHVAIAGTGAAAANFAAQGGREVYVRPRQPLRFVAETPFDATWFGTTSGQATFKLELFIKQGDQWVSQGSDERTVPGTGPKLERGALHEDLILSQPDTYEIKAVVTTTATPEGSSPVQAVDEITATVHIVGSSQS